LREKAAVHMEAEESGERFTDCTVRKWQQMCIKTVKMTMAVASIAQSETMQWIPRVEALNKYTEAEIMEVVSQIREWFFRVDQAVEKVQKRSHTKSAPIVIAEVIEAMSREITEVVDGVRQFVTAIHICQAKVEVIQANIAVKEVRAHADVKIEAMISKSRVGMSAEMKKAVKEAKEKVTEKIEEAEEAEMVMRYVEEAAKRGEFPPKTAKETREAMIETNRRWKIVIEQLDETWNKLIKTAVYVSTISQTEAHAWVLKAEKITKHVDEKTAGIALQTEIQVKEGFSQISKWVEEVNKESLQAGPLMESNFTSIAAIAKTVIQNTVKVITETEKIIARVDVFQAEVETVQTMKVAEKAEADAREAAAEAIIAKIECKVVATKIKKEEVETKATEKKRVARIAREEAEKKAAAVKAAAVKAAKERARLVEAEVEMRDVQKIAAIAYVTNESSNTISVINTASRAVITTMKVGYRPTEIAVTCHGIWAYVTNYVGNTVSVIDIASHAVIATIEKVGLRPNGIAITPDDRKIYVTNWGDHTVSVIDAISRAVIATIPVERYPGKVVITPNGTEAYVIYKANDKVAVVNTTNYAVIVTVSVGNEPHGMAITPDGTEVYVTNSKGHTVSVIEIASHTVIATIPVGGEPYGIAIAPDGMKAYVANSRRGTVSVIDTYRRTVTATILVGVDPYEVAIISNIDNIYVTDKSKDIVYIIDTITHQVQPTTIPVGKGPHSLTIRKMLNT
jgi:YVTN family beta-propeller protein